MWWTNNCCLKILIYIALIIIVPIGFIVYIVSLIFYTLYSWIFCKALCCRKNEFSQFDVSTSHHCKNGKFCNPWKSYNVSWYDSLLLLFWDMNKVPPGKSLNVHNINWEIFNANTNLNKIKFIWIGQASCLLSINKWIVLTDPIFSDRPSMSQYFGPKRFTPIPSNLWNKLPYIDIVLISHDHFDHLDYHTVKRLIVEKKVKYWCVPLRLKEWIADNFSHLQTNINIVELDWWYSAIINNNNNNIRICKEEEENKTDIELQLSNNNSNINDNEIKIICCPSQHHCHRGIFDKNYRLWCSFVIVTSNNKRIFFGGDTGYRSVPRQLAINNNYKLFTEENESKLIVCPAFKQIGNLYGPFDLCMIPIGGYLPRWFMSRVHLNPYDSICIHKDLQSKQSVAIHWGTFSLTEEKYDEPPQLLNELMIKYSIAKHQFMVVDPGQITQF